MLWETSQKHKAAEEGRDLPMLPCPTPEFKQGCHKQDTQDYVWMGYLIPAWMDIPSLPWSNLFQCCHRAQADCIAASSHCLQLKSAAHENQQQLHVSRNCYGMWLVYTYSKSVHYLAFFQSRFLTSIWYWKFSPSSAAGSYCPSRITLACWQLWNFKFYYQIYCLWTYWNLDLTCLILCPWNSRFCLVEISHWTVLNV